MFSESILNSVFPQSPLTSRAVKPKVYIFQSSGQDQRSFESSKGGVYSSALFKEISAMHRNTTVREIMTRVHDTVTKTVSARQGEKQTPKELYLGGAKNTDLMKPLVVQTQRVVVIVPSYGGDMDLPGAKTGAQHFLVNAAPYSFSETCKFDFMIDSKLVLPEHDLANSFDFESRVAFHGCTQSSVRAKLEEVVDSGANAMVLFYCHGQFDNNDQYVYFEAGAESERITGKYIAQLISRLKGGTLVLIVDMCLAGGFPDRGDLLEVAMVPRTVEADTSPQAESSAMVPVLSELCDRLAAKTHMDVKGCKISMSVSVESREGESVALLNMSKDGETRTLNFSSGTLAVLPSAPAPEGDLNPRSVAMASATMLAGVTTLLNSLTAAWSVGSAAMVGLPAFFAANAPTLICVPLIAAGIVLAISALVAFGFYFCFIRRRYAQVLSPVILTALISAAAQYLCGAELLKEWFAPDTVLGAMRGSFVVSLVTILVAIALNWRSIRRSEVMMLVFKSVVEQSADCMQLAMLLVHTYFVGGGQNYSQTMHLKVGGIDHHVLYRPRVISNRTGKLTCGFKGPSGQYFKLFEDTHFTSFNETFGVTCDHGVFRALVSKYSRGEADSLCALEREGVVYDLRALRESRVALIKNFGSDGEDAVQFKLDTAFEPEPCELTDACFHAPLLNASMSISHVEKGLEQISEPFQRVVDGVSAFLAKSLQHAGGQLWTLAYPRK